MFLLFPSFVLFLQMQVKFQNTLSSSFESLDGSPSNKRRCYLFSFKYDIWLYLQKQQKEGKFQF